MQQSIYLAEKLYPGRVTHNTPSAHRLRGPFQAELSPNLGDGLWVQAATWG
jgi:hypothetical protein